MEGKIIWIFYSIISIILSLITIKGTADKTYKFIGLLFTLTFIIILFGHFGLRSLWLHPTIILTIAFLFFLVRIIKSREAPAVHKFFSVALPSVTVLKLYFSALHLNGYNQIKVFSLIILITSILYFVATVVIKNKFHRDNESLEVNGLFAIILLSTIIR